jgi:hypothetical protein
MTTGITPDTFYEKSYLSVAEFKDAPTSIDYDNKRRHISGNRSDWKI